MEFTADVRGEHYHFSFLNDSSVLVSAKQSEYILYKNKIWQCADDLSRDVIAELGEVIDEHRNGFRP